MQKYFLLVAAINGFLVVAFGAFGAHALQALLSVEMLEVYRTAVHYQMFHTVAFVMVHALRNDADNVKKLNLIGHQFVLGMVLFCGSLYLLALSGITKLGIITPFGGVILLAAWLQLALFCATNKRLL